MAKLALSTFHQDGRFAADGDRPSHPSADVCGSLKRDAGRTVFAVLMVGLGVGASCTVFSVLNALLLRPLPFTDPDRLVWIANGTSENLSARTTQVANLIDLQAQSGSFSGTGGYSPFYGAGDILPRRPLVLKMG